MKIQRLTIEDIERLRDIRLRALRSDPDAFGSTFEETAQRPPENWRQQLIDLATFVAVLDDVDVGMVRGVALEEDPRQAVLISMWVAPEARRHGAGKALVEALVKWAQNEGFVSLVLDVAVENTRARRFYARTSFVETGQVSTLPPPREHIRELRCSLTLFPVTQP